VEFGGMVIARVRNGQIVEGWNCIDFLSMYQQMGWVTNPVAPA
jgi:predicted ester cyclase